MTIMLTVTKRENTRYILKGTFAIPGLKTQLQQCGKIRFDDFE